MARSPFKRTIEIDESVLVPLKQEAHRQAVTAAKLVDEMVRDYLAMCGHMDAQRNDPSIWTAQAGRRRKHLEGAAAGKWGVARTHVLR